MVPSGVSGMACIGFKGYNWSNYGIQLDRKSAMYIAIEKREPSDVSSVRKGC